MPIFLIRMPQDYFLRHEPMAGGWRDRHPAVVLSVRMVRNAIGIVFVVAGLALTVLPGPGVVMVLLGLYRAVLKDKEHPLAR